MFNYLTRFAKSFLHSLLVARQRLAEKWVVLTERHLDRVWAFLPLTNKLAKSVRNPPRIGIAVLAHNRPDYLQLCLDSLFATNLHDYDVTFLIQDDGSTDSRVREIIEQPRASNLRIVRSFTAKGHNSWGAAFNKAIQHLIRLGDFDLVGSCDSDAFFHPEWLHNMVQVACWAKQNHRLHIIGPFSCFNSSDYVFHRVLGTFDSPHGRYVVKQRMGALAYFYFTHDLTILGQFEESKDDETLMTERFAKLRVRNFCTETSYVEHLGRESVLDHWRPKAVGANAAFGMRLAREGWFLPTAPTIHIPKHRLQNDLVLHIKYGGLGDHLFYSHLPRIAKETGRYRNVLISESSVFRSQETRRLVWEMNPFVDGFCDEICPYPDSQHLDTGCNLLDQLMLLYDLDDGRRFHEPEIFYSPKKIEILRGKTVFDPNFISNAGDLTSAKIAGWFSARNVQVDFQMDLRERFIAINRFGEWLKAYSLEEFCDILYSCDNIYCLVTGTATLAASLGRNAKVLVGDGISRFFLHSKLHTYIKI